MDWLVLKKINKLKSSHLVKLLGDQSNFQWGNLGGREVLIRSKHEDYEGTVRDFIKKIRRLGRFLDPNNDKIFEKQIKALKKMEEGANGPDFFQIIGQIDQMAKEELKKGPLEKLSSYFELVEGELKFQAFDLEKISQEAIEARSFVVPSKSGRFRLSIDEALNLSYRLNQFKQEASNKEKDRYKDILPFKFNRVKDPVYVNASYIESHGLRYISAQGPKAETIVDFWRMVQSEGADLIVNLTMATEKGKDKCHNYWSGTKVRTLKHGATVRKVSDQVLLEEKEGQRIVQREFALDDPEKGVRIIRQLHYENWPDFGVPNRELFVKLIELTGTYSGPLIAHCSAGVGRSGTFIAAHSVIEGVVKRENEAQFSPEKTLFYLRLQRKGMIQTFEQFETFIESVKEYAQKKGRQ